MILQKHTSKFVAGLFNSLGITACVSLTSCGGENKVKQTENQGEKLKSVLLSKGLDEEDAKVIAEWLEKNKKDISGLNGDILQEIFNEDTNKIKEVAEKLGLELTESDPNHDDEKKKEIQQWVTKLNDLEDAAFGQLNDGLKEKVAQKFIASGIGINDVTAIKEKLADFINEVVEAKKESEISLKFDGNGKVIITKVANDETTDFTFDTFEVFEKFVGYLKDKEITDEEVELSFAFDVENVKICGHQTGFKVTDCFEKFLNCFEILTKIKNLNVSNLSLKISEGKLSLNEEDLSSKEYFKGKEFWTLVKDHADLFGITDKSKFEIEKKGGSGNETVKIGGFETTLKWSDVVAEGGNAFVENSGWDKIFKIKDKESKTEVTVKFAEGKCTCSEIDAYKSGVVLNSLEVLKNLVAALNDKTVKIGEKASFSLAFEGKKVKVCGDETGFDVMEGASFATLLGHVKSLKEVGAVAEDFKIKIAADTDDIKLDTGAVNKEFMKTADFWGAVKEYQDDLFSDLGKEKIKVSRVDSSKKVKIGSTELDFEVLDEKNCSIVTGWSGVFEIDKIV